ncbi:MAG: N-glycosylase/DNA lyase [Candidatus Korarchaeota archaeon]|nr:N-glycosylase/DNA lyase [Thermoproteota archaeon]
MKEHVDSTTLFARFFPDENAILQVARVISGIRLVRDSYDDPRLFPPRNAPIEYQFGYFAAMVAIDHRTGTPLDSFEGYVEGEFFHGSDLLYRLGMLIFYEDPEFFSPVRLSNLTYNDARRLLEFNGKVLWDYHVRTFLLRDLGLKTVKFYGSFENLLNVESISELIRRLRLFRAYEDPVAKKSYLLAKFLEGRELANFRDRDNAEVPVDNHISRLAIRLGIIKFSNYEHIESQIEVPRKYDVRLRLEIRKAWRKVSMLSKVDPFTLDDFLWSLGRKVCRQSKPLCESCPFNKICLARISGKFWLEHCHTLTWYY